ncbi:MAG: nitrogenase-stabilizing/protective protein NifW [Gammaproteobacteria bacterium]|nr:nitrogenase-stabilizing/protective protein NifW [Gammaproteobacteria bacterium]
MTTSLERLCAHLQGLSTAEEFLTFFDIPYAPDVVHTSRLHILQRFHQYLRATQAPADDEATLRAHGRTLLERAYADFVHSTPREERVFRVFCAGERQVPLAALRAALPSQDHRS